MCKNGNKVNSKYYTVKKDGKNRVKAGQEWKKITMSKWKQGVII